MGWGGSSGDNEKGPVWDRVPSGLNCEEAKDKDNCKVGLEPMRPTEVAAPARQEVPMMTRTVITPVMPSAGPGEGNMERRGTSGFLTLRKVAGRRDPGQQVSAVQAPRGREDTLGPQKTRVAPTQRLQPPLGATSERREASCRGWGYL